MLHGFEVEADRSGVIAFFEGRSGVEEEHIIGPVIQRGISSEDGIVVRRFLCREFDGFGFIGNCSEDDAEFLAGIAPFGMVNGTAGGGGFFAEKGLGVFLGFFRSGTDGDAGLAAAEEAAFILVAGNKCKGGCYNRCCVTGDLFHTAIHFNLHRRNSRIHRYRDLLPG